MSAELILILGGARSGKSSYAEKLAARMGRRVLYVATAEPGDEEMARRIEAHRLARPATWQTLESSRHVGQALAEVNPGEIEVILLDCLTLLVSNTVVAMEAKSPAAVEAAVREEVEIILSTLARLTAPMIVVSNEVGLGLVPPYPLGRIYRDVLGWANQRLAAEANQVLFMIAGLPMTLKNEA